VLSPENERCFCIAWPFILFYGPNVLSLIRDISSCRNLFRSWKLELYFLFLGQQDSKMLTLESGVAFRLVMGTQLIHFMDLNIYMVFSFLKCEMNGFSVTIILKTLSQHIYFLASPFCLICIYESIIDSERFLFLFLFFKCTWRVKLMVFYVCIALIFPGKIEGSNSYWFFLSANYKYISIYRPVMSHYINLLFWI